MCVCVCVLTWGVFSTPVAGMASAVKRPQSQVPHTHPHTETSASALYLFCWTRPFCMCFKAVPFFPYSYCAKMWTWQPQPTHSYITSRTFIFGFYKMHISEMWLPNSQHILIFSTWISMLGAINESNTNSVLHSSTYSLQANVFSYLHSSSSQSGLIFSSFKRTCLLHTMPLRSYHSYLHKILGSMCSVGCWL